MGKVIYLSPSEHGVGANKCLVKGCYEDNHTRPIAESLSKHLTFNGFEVYIAKPKTTMGQRCTESNKVGADLHIPIHTNASSSNSARYLMFMFFADTTKYRDIFNAVSPHLEEVYPKNLKSKFAVRKDLYEVNIPKAKTMYCELGFHTNQMDCDDFIHNPELVGKALAKGICEYYGVDFKEESDKLYRVQVGAYSNKANADKMLTKLKEAGFNGYVTEG